MLIRTLIALGLLAGALALPTVPAANAQQANLADVIYSEFKFLVDTKRPSVIQGVNDAVIGMRLGGTRTIDCPPRLHWGRIGSGDGKIPPNTNLIIRIKLLALE